MIGDAESARLAALHRYELLDTPSEQEFEDLAGLAALLCGAPIAAISLVDRDRIWFKAKVGLEVSEADREASFCSAALASSELLEIPDASLDSRFADTPLVCGPAHIRFYAGQPLVTEGGFRVGTICVLNSHPNGLTDAQRNGLALLARQTIALMEGRLARKNLTKGLERFQRLHDSMRDAFAQVNLSGELIDVNPAFCEMVGYSREECLKLTIKSLTPEKWHAYEDDILKTRVLKNGFSDVYEKEYIRRNGHVFPVELHTFLTRDDSGAPETMWAIVRDISERKAAAEAVHKSEEKYRLLFENLTSGFALHEIICDDEGRPVDYRYLEVNPAFESLTGLTAEMVLGKRILEVVPLTEKYWIEVFGKVAVTGQPTQYENFSAELGKYYSVWVFSPKLGQFAVIISDTTSTKLIEEELRAKERRLSHAISATSDAIWEWNYRTGEIYYSPRWYEMLGYEPDGFPMDFDIWTKSCHPEDLDLALFNISQVLESQVESGCHVEFRMKRKQGDWIWILARGNVVERDESGRPLLFSGTNTDITDRKLAEQALLELNESLEQRVIERTRALAERNEDLELFSYAISHDLRAPLRAIRGYADLLSEDIGSQLGDEPQKLLARIGVSAIQMFDMLDGILAYSRIGSRKSEPSEISLKRFMSQMVEEARGQSGRAHVEIRSELQDVDLMIDSEALAICVRNLLQNAVKFAAAVPKPLVEVRARSESDRCVIEIADNGVGFDMADSGRIFEMFKRLRPSAPGTGVGLALVARAVTKLDGVIRPESELGHGATFTLEIPKKS